MSTPPIMPGPAATANTEVSAADKARNERLGREFETVFLSQFVDEMMSTIDYGPASGGQGAEMWRSFMSQALAEKLAERGGLGLGANIEQMLDAYRR
ncbi:rod-binding protein [Aquicoccus sp. SU-CL01552]|uniref:rod-binding protein n=1 Tax=Aquicoccus sp. SU-CL01552 TaxID=3127656 RepID=UPI0031033C31